MPSFVFWSYGECPCHEYRSWVTNNSGQLRGVGGNCRTHDPDHILLYAVISVRMNGKDTSLSVARIGQRNWMTSGILPFLCTNIIPGNCPLCFLFSLALARFMCFAIFVDGGGGSPGFSELSKCINVIGFCEKVECTQVAAIGGIICTAKSTFGMVSSGCVNFPKRMLVVNLHAYVNKTIERNSINRSTAI